MALPKFILPAAITPTTRLTVALSGGPDSTALLNLVAKYSAEKVQAIYIDHKLRPTSALEGEQVVKRANLIPNVEAHVVKIDWKGEPPTTTKMMAQARVKRYEALVQTASAKETPYILTAHHRDDLIETFLYRFGKGSGLEGLSPMTNKTAGVPVRLEAGSRVKLVRPLLEAQKADLVRYCKDNNLEYVVDPTNTNTSIQRNAIRKTLSDIQASGKHPLLNSENLWQMCQSFRGYENDLMSQVVPQIRKYASFNPNLGIYSLNLIEPGWFRNPAIGVRALSEMIRQVSANCNAMRTNLMLSTYQKIIQMLNTKTFSGAITAHSTIICPPLGSRKIGEHNWIIAPEMDRSRLGNVEGTPITENQTILWGERFYIKIQNLDKYASLTLMPPLAAAGAMGKVPERRVNPIKMTSHRFLVRRLTTQDIHYIKFSRPWVTFQQRTSMYQYLKKVPEIIRGTIPSIIMEVSTTSGETLNYLVSIPSLNIHLCEGVKTRLEYYVPPRLGPVQDYMVNTNE